MDEREGVLMEGRGKILKYRVWLDGGGVLMEVTCKIIFFTLVIFKVTLIIQAFKSKFK